MRTKMTNETKWRKLLAWLRRNFRTQMPVKVRRIRGYKAKHKCFGECVMHLKEAYNGACVSIPERCDIFIERAQSHAMQRDTLLHEWAHAMTLWGNDTDEHGEEWSLAFGRIYRLFVEWNYGIERRCEEE